MDLVKAEILWSRVCTLDCSYCAMKTGAKVVKDLSLWKKGVEQLKKLSCNFCAIYGAEPLDDFEGLPQFVRMLHDNNILCTVITNGCSKDSKAKLTALYANGLRSLTTSYDGVEVEIIDKSSKAKTSRGLTLLRWFRDTFVDLRDVAVVMTISRKNYNEIPLVIKAMSDEGIWTLFDIIHPDRGQRGSKCKNSSVTNELLFQEEDVPKVLKVLEKISQMKDQSYLVHWSKNLVDYITEHPKVLLNYRWHCVEKDVFPSWITVENTGEVYCCDDFHFGRPTKAFYLWEIADKFEEFREFWSYMAETYCPGCLWNTHFDANQIKRGVSSFGDYVHQK